MKRTKKPHENMQMHMNARAPSRQTIDDLTENISAIQHGRIDCRTTRARRLLAIRQRLEDSPAATTAELLKDQLAVNATISEELIRHLASHDFEVMDSDGNINPILAKQWADSQRAILTSASALLRLGGGTAPQKTKQASMRKGTALLADETMGDANDISALVLQGNSGVGITD